MFSPTAFTTASIGRLGDFPIANTQNPETHVTEVIPSSSAVAASTGPDTTCKLHAPNIQGFSTPAKTTESTIPRSTPMQHYPILSRSLRNAFYPIQPRPRSAFAVRRRPSQFRNKTYLPLPDKDRLEREHVARVAMRMAAHMTPPTKAEKLAEAALAARAAASRDRRARFKHQVRLRRWIETQTPPWTRGLVEQVLASTNATCNTKIECPSITVTTPEGETRWLEDPNVYL